MPADCSSEQTCALRLKVLADPTRLSVVHQLMGGPKHVSELNEEFGMDQSLLSHHLKILRQAGLVVSERDGKAVLYRLSPEVAKETDAKAIDLGCCSLVF